MRGILLILISICFVAWANPSKEKILIGRVEWVELSDLKLRLRARIDTGAKTTSLHAINIEEVNLQGQLHVKFNTIDHQGKVIELTRKVESMQKITNPTGFSSKRYVIKEKIKLGHKEYMISVNLNDRAHMDFKFLVGRNLLLGKFIVDVARSHVLGD